MVGAVVSTGEGGVQVAFLFHRDSQGFHLKKMDFKTF